MADLVYMARSAWTALLDSIRAKGGTSAPMTADQAKAAVEAIETGGGGTEEAPLNDVNFFDYDGTLVYSYSATEFSALTEMPANPSHSGLTAQGWNWTLAEAKAEVSSRGKCNIGQMYITDDGKTRIYCSIDSQILTITVGIFPNGTVVVDWGDSSATDTLTGTSLTIMKYVSHTYAVPGDYVIALDATSGSFRITGTSLGSNIIAANASNQMRRRFLSAIYKIEMGRNVSLGNDALENLFHCETVTIPNGITTVPQYAFYSGTSLKAIVLPSGVTSIGRSAVGGLRCASAIVFPPTVTSYVPSSFQGYYTLRTIVYPTATDDDSVGVFVRQCFALRSVVFPPTLTSIGGYSVENCCALESFTIPASVTSIGTSALRYAYSLRELHFKSSTPPALGNSGVFDGLPTTCKIFVQTGSLEAYTSATNYPSSSTYTYVEE